MTNLEEVSSIPLTAPKVESATKIGITNAITPNRRSANVCWQSCSKMTRKLYVPQPQLRRL